MEIFCTKSFQTYHNVCEICQRNFADKIATNGWKFHLGCVQCHNCEVPEMIAFLKVNDVFNFECLKCSYKWSYDQKGG